MKMNNLDCKKYFAINDFGEIEIISPLKTGLSGSQVYSVKTEKGNFVLRSYSSTNAEWNKFISLQQFLADNQITPKIYFIHNEDKVIVTKQIEGPAFVSSLNDPNSAMSALTSLVKKLKKIQQTSIEEKKITDPILVINDLWKSESTEEHFPEWALGFKKKIDEFEILFRLDSRQVIAHNDLNPGNILWDEKEVWIIDWENAGINHPFYDLATLTIFLNLPKEVTQNLLKEFTENFEADIKLFDKFCDFVSLMYGLRFLSLSPAIDPTIDSYRENIASLSECFSLMAQHKLDLQSPRGQQMIAYALLKKAF